MLPVDRDDRDDRDYDPFADGGRVDGPRAHDDAPQPMLKDPMTQDAHQAFLRAVGVGPETRAATTGAQQVPGPLEDWWQCVRTAKILSNWRSKLISLGMDRDEANALQSMGEILDSFWRHLTSDGGFQERALRASIGR